MMIEIPIAKLLCREISEGLEGIRLQCLQSVYRFRLEQDK